MARHDSRHVEVLRARARVRVRFTMARHDSRHVEVLLIHIRRERVSHAGGIDANIEVDLTRKKLVRLELGGLRRRVRNIDVLEEEIVLALHLQRDAWIGLILHPVGGTDRMLVQLVGRGVDTAASESCHLDLALPLAE